jgi:hypothetical protein
MVKTTVTSPFVDDFPTTPRVIVPMEQEAPDRWFRWCGASDHVRGPRSGGTVARPFYDGEITVKEKAFGENHLISYMIYSMYIHIL